MAKTNLLPMFTDNIAAYGTILGTTNDTAKNFDLDAVDNSSAWITMSKTDDGNPIITYDYMKWLLFGCDFCSDNFRIKRVIFNGKATVVYFNDGVKVVVKCADMDAPSREHAILYAIVKRLYGKVVQTESGEKVVDGNGFMNYLKKIVDNGFDQEAASKKPKKTPVLPPNHPKTVTTTKKAKTATPKKYAVKSQNS